MRRLAPVVAAAVLALGAGAARAEPLDLDLSRLGAPDPAVWTALAAGAGVALAPGDAEAYARAAKERFAVLSSEVALAVSSPLLSPGSTTGYAGFDVAIEGSYSPVHSDPRGAAPPAGAAWPAAYSATPWPTRLEQPDALTTTGVHVRKALPFSLEMGGRLVYLNKSSYLAAQGEAKWALNEGSDTLPDFAVRIAHTRLFGQRDWSLGATDLDFTVSKRWGVNGVTSFTPYAAARFTFVSASTERIDFGGELLGATPAEQAPAVSAFPHLRVGLYRTTLGVRMTASVVSLAAEVTYFGGKSYSGNDDATLPAGEYGDFSVPSSFAGAARLGWEF